MSARAVLAKQVNRFLRANRYRRFTSTDAVLALPGRNAQSIRAYLQRQARLGRLCCELRSRGRGPGGTENVYWVPEKRAFGRYEGRMVMSQGLIDAMSALK